MAKSNLNTQAKRKRELAKKDKRAAKDRKRALRKAERRAASMNPTATPTTKSTTEEQLGQVSHFARNTK